MTQLEAEKKILDHVLEIKRIYHKYNPDGVYLNVCISKGNISFNNSYWEKDKERPIDAFVHKANEECPFSFQRLGGETVNM